MIRTIIVDDESNILKELEENLKRIEDIALEGAFTDSLAALQFVMAHEVDMLVLDIEMPKINGIELAESARKVKEKIQTIFVTGYSKYAFEAFGTDALSYLMKPYTFNELNAAVDKVRIMLTGIENRKEEKTVKVQTFGKFEVLYNGKNIAFSSRKAKELLAVLVDSQGGAVTMENVIGCLWEERSINEATKALYRKVVSRMRATLNEAGCGDIVIYRKGQLAVNADAIDCDYYRALKRDEKNADMFLENYLEEYSWAEERNGLLTNYLQRGKW